MSWYVNPPPHPTLDSTEFGALEMILSLKSVHEKEESSILFAVGV